MNDTIIQAQEAFRSQAWRDGVSEALASLYGEQRVPILLDRFEDLVARNWCERPDHLLRRDASSPAIGTATRRTRSTCFTRIGSAPKHPAVTSSQPCAIRCPTSKSWA